MTDSGDGWSESTRTVVRSRAADLEATHRGVATFGGGTGPGAGEVVREFVRRYGWRAYALPVLLVVTVIALLTTSSTDPGRSSAAAEPRPTAQSAPSGASSAPMAPTTIDLKSDAGSGSSYQDVLKVGQLPAGGPYTKDGTGSFRVLAGSTKPVGHGGRLFRYEIEVENGITGIDVQQFATLVDRTLDDPRSWSGHGIRVQRVSSGPVDFHVSLTSSYTVRKYCGYEIHVESSCYAQAGSVADLTVNRVFLNDARWVRGAAAYVGDLSSYRVYLINHEDGHAIGHQHAHQCLPGGLAPVMMQQTFGLKSAATGAMCEANPWPYPQGAKGAPGAEQADTPQNDEYKLQD